MVWMLARQHRASRIHSKDNFLILSLNKMRIVESHKQTFQATTDVNRASFRFTRVYKTNEKQRFLITVGNIGWQTTMDTDAFSPPLFYLEGLFGGHCITQTNLGDVQNGWFLGGDGYNDIGTKKAHLTSYSKNTIQVDDLPLNPFEIVMKHLDGVDYPSTFIVSFNIDIVEE